MKIHPVRAELFYADGRTDGRTYMTKLIVALHNLRKRLRTRKRRNLLNEWSWS